MSSRYVAVHTSPKGPGDARPTALQIIEDEQLTGKLIGKVVFITGCSSGLGIQTARALLATGATLYLTARNLEKAHSALGDLAENKNVHLLEMDLNSLSSVRSCAALFLSKSSSLSLLICNAGVMVPPEGRTADGFETQFGTNHLAHFLLVQLFKDTLIASATTKMSSRVIMLSSSGHRMSEVQFDDYNFDEGYDAWKAYGQSKTAMIWTANEIERRYGSTGLHAYSLNPGMSASGLQKNVTADMMEEWSQVPGLQEAFKSQEQGAATTVWAAVAQALEGQGGQYTENCQVVGEMAADAGPLDPGYAPWVSDSEKAQKLYELSLKLIS
ncbi:uncharacterized protein TRUGW13939_02703 [Talaromyces rugulosus]|uniref:Uncharacterized protein n=1 Tax=Talaromyces rugulosus TaxID=121627 RepID=A0A7H8QNR0_TALRU|nr:uncharacterized protein TRUGW13939_02703 [Talaromyces rugulosus]QKX55607.1 hypothetical protein TRUGW13939_02703 [Talaromyces rugulosus]